MTTTELLDHYSLLTDGRSVRIRSVRPEDRDELLAMNAATSDRSLYLRFFGLSRDAADRFVERDLLGRSTMRALVAEVAGHLVGVASYEPVDLHEAEIAVLVVDRFHHTGVGTVLLEYLASLARHHGIDRFVADVLPENGAMIQALHDLGYPADVVFQDGVERIRLHLAATPLVTGVVTEREGTADRASLRPLLTPRSIVLIGVGHRPESVGRQVLKNLLSLGFNGDISIVHPSQRKIEGIACVPSVAELPEVADLAVIAVPAGSVVSTVADCGRRGIPAAIVLSSGFAELGPSGRDGQSELLLVAREHGIRLLGPNCLGIVNTDPKVRLNATFAPIPLRRGGLAVASQSGALGIGLIQAANRAGLGLAQFVSLGNKADVSTNDLLLAWETDPSVELIAIYLESFGNPVKFGQIARRVSRTKPILAIKAGRSVAGQRAGLTHTAAAASSEAAVDALFDQAGVVRVDDLPTLLDAARVLTGCELPAGPRLAIVGNSGGPEILAADAAAAAGLDVIELSPRLQHYLARAVPQLAGSSNPVDLGAGAQPPQVEAAIRLLMASDEVDLVLGVITPTSVADPTALLRTFERVAATMSKPLVVVVTGEPDGMRPHSPQRALPVFEFPEPAARSLGVLWRYARVRGQIDSTVLAPVTDIPAGAVELVTRELAAGTGWLSADAGAELLAYYDVPVAPYRVVHGADACARAAAELGFPVAVKACGPIPHKSELGGVCLDVATPAAARRAYAQVAPLTDETALVQPMTEGDIELLVGGVRDASFGPLVVVGAGGVLTDLLEDRRVLLAPVSTARATAALLELRLARLLAGYRGRPPVSQAALARLVNRVSRLIAELPQVAELDLNPVVGKGDSLIVTDFKIRLAAPPVQPDPTTRDLSGSAAGRD